MIRFAKNPYGERVFVDDAISKHEYFCFACGAPLVPVRGDCRQHHFRHRGERVCTDTWYGAYSDNAWHFGWQDCYPRQNRELTLALGATRHRADVIVGKSVIEFQHSVLSRNQFDERNSFYTDLGYKVIWLFDLSDAYARDEIAAKLNARLDCEGRPKEFTWQNPRIAFNGYDLRLGKIDLFFQLAYGEDGTACVVRVQESCETGFEEFTVERWYTTDEFLAYTGLRDGACPAPDLEPLVTNPEFLNFSKSYDLHLNPEQERAAQTVDGATLLVAVPGSGKTTTMVAHLGYLAIQRKIPPESIIAVTYGKHAATELQERFARQFGNKALSKKICFCTINSLAFRIYRDWYNRAPGRRRRTVIPEHDAKRLLRKLYGEVEGVKFVSESTLVELTNLISWAKNNMLRDEDLPELDRALHGFFETYKRYQTQLKETNRIDFDDQMRAAQFALDTDPELLANYRVQYRYWSVDEAQDTSLLQHMLIRTLVGEDGAGNIFMVGDEDQSIYGYRGAYPEALLNFKFDYPNAHVLKMECNYRSGDEIVSAANAFVGGCKGRIQKKMVSMRGAGSTVRVEEVPTRLDQFDRVYELIGAQHKGETLAVIYRDNETSIPLIDRLIRERVSFTLRGNVNTLFTSPAVRDIKAFFRLAIDPYDELAFKRICKKTGAGYVDPKDADWACKNAKRYGMTVLEGLKKQMSSYRKRWQIEADTEKAAEIESVINAVAQLSPADAIDYLMAGGYGDWCDEHNVYTERIDLLKPIAEREESISSLLDRLKYLDKVFGDNSSYRKPTDLTISTTHSVKGLEFDRVIILDVIKGIFPSARQDPLDRSKDAAKNRQEERRLFYVAMTRAKDELVFLRPTDEATPFVDEVCPRPVPVSDVDLIPASAPKAELALNAQSPTLAQSSGRASDGQGNTRRKGASTLRRSGSVDSMSKPAVSRYDVDTWEVLIDHGPSYRRVEYGGMQAEVTRGPAGKTVDLLAPWTDGQIRDLAEHIGEFARGCSEVAVHLDVTGAQRMHDVRLDADANGVTLFLENAGLFEVLSRLMLELETLEDARAVLLLDCWVPDGPSGERRVLDVDGESRRVLLSADLYDE